MEIDVLINETPELDLKFVMNDVGVAQIVSLPLGKDYTIAQIKLALAAEFLGTVDDLDEVRALAKRLVLRRLGNKLYDGNTAYSASLVDGATVVVERLSAAPMRPRRSEQKAELVHHTVPVGAMVFSGTESGESLCAAIEGMLIEFAGGDHERALRLLLGIDCTLSDGAAPPLAVGARLEARQEKVSGKQTQGVLRLVCINHIFHDAVLQLCVDLSSPCPIWARGSHNSVLVWLLEQLSNTLHNHHDELGLTDLVERMNQDMETRWGSYVKVAANFAANNVQIRLRVARFLAKNEWFDGGGGELGAAARLVYWACNSSATLLHMHIVAEAGRAIVTPAIHWLEEKDGRRLLEFPAYLRRVLSRLAALSDGQVDDFPETCAYAKSAGIGLDVVRDRLGLAAKILSSYIINRIGYMFRVPLSHVLLVDPSPN